MPKILYANVKELQAKINQYYKETDLVAPRSFRVYLGVSKQTLSNWKKNNTKFFDLIKEHEDKILAKIEEYAIYGQAHPDIKKNLVVVGEYESFYADKYNKDGKLIAKGGIKVRKVEVHVTGKFNQVGAIMTLRAYDKDQYAPELRNANDLKLEKQEQYVINTDNTAPMKKLGITNTSDTPTTQGTHTIEAEVKEK